MRKELLQVLAEEAGGEISDLRYRDKEEIAGMVKELKNSPQADNWSDAEWKEAIHYLGLEQ